MASCSGESVEAVERRQGFWWTREDTLLLISKRKNSSTFSTMSLSVSQSNTFSANSSVSEPAIFVAEVAKRPKNPLTFSGIRQQAHQNSQNIRNVRSFGKRKLTNSGIYSYSGIFPNERALSCVYN